MKLLFLTQVIDADDAILGFVSRWVEGLARHAERVRVVALEVGDVSGLPENVDVREVGRRGIVRRYLRYRRILSEALDRDGFDCVLAHMVPRYALVAERPARRAGAGLFLWYTHKGVDERLRRAVEVVDRVFTASKESLRVDTPRKLVTGHGIDLEHFDDRGEEPLEPPRLLAVGRLTRAKDPLTVLAAASKLVERGRELRLDFAGGALAAGDEELVEAVRREAESGVLAGRVRLLGEVPYPRIADLYRRSSVLVNASLTGSVDKVVLEAMATRRPVVTCNESFPPLLSELGERAQGLLFDAGDADGLAQRIEALLELPREERARLGEDLRAIVARDHEVDRLMGRLVAEMQGVGGADLMELSIVIPSWNTVDLLRACLTSIREADKPQTEVIVVDNGSEDGSADMVEREFPEVRLERNPLNEGFARGCNQGMRLATGRYVLLLNADTEIRGNALVRMVEFLEGHPHHGAVAPQLVHPDGEIQTACMRFPNVWTPLFFATPLERWFPKSPELRRYFMMGWDHRDERDIEQPPAACLLLRREVIERVGMFDEDLWLFFNDVDLSLRMARAGWKTRYLVDAKVMHHEGASTSKFGSFVAEWHRNRLAYFRKHHGALAGVWVKLCVTTMLLDFLLTQGWRRLTGRPYEDPRPMLRSFGDFLRR